MPQDIELQSGGFEIAALRLASALEDFSAKMDVQIKLQTLLIERMERVSDAFVRSSLRIESAIGRGSHVD